MLLSKISNWWKWWPVFVHGRKCIMWYIVGVLIYDAKIVFFFSSHHHLSAVVCGWLMVSCKFYIAFMLLEPNYEAFCQRWLTRRRRASARITEQQCSLNDVFFGGGTNLPSPTTTTTWQEDENERSLLTIGQAPHNPSSGRRFSTWHMRGCGNEILISLKGFPLSLNIIVALGYKLYSKFNVLHYWWIR